MWCPISASSCEPSWLHYLMLKFISLTHSFADQLVNGQGVADYWEDYQAWEKIPHKITDHPSTSFFGRQGLQKNWENGWPTLSLQDGINKKRQTSSLVFWGEVVPDWEIFWQVKYWMGREARPEIDAHRRRIWINTKLYMSHCQMLGKVEYGLPAKIWRLVGCTEMLSW